MGKMIEITSAVAGIGSLVIAVMQFQHDTQLQKEPLDRTLKDDHYISKVSTPPSSLNLDMGKEPLKTFSTMSRSLHTKEDIVTSTHTLSTFNEQTIGRKSSAEFSIDSCGVITDHFTQQEWLVGPNKITSWEEAQLWLNQLNQEAQCGGRWRMPTAAEVKTLHRPTKTAGLGPLIGNRRWPAHLDPVFSSIGEGAWVWLKTSRKNGVTMNLNRMTKVIKHPQGNYTTRVFGVR